jgi:hypothetical protein
MRSLFKPRNQPFAERSLNSFLPWQSIVADIQKPQHNACCKRNV